MDVAATMAGGEARSGRRGGGSSALEEVKRRGENELGFVGWLSGDETATNGVSRGGDGGDGIPVNNSKFQSPVHKLSFSSSSRP